MFSDSVKSLKKTSSGKWKSNKAKVDKKINIKMNPATAF